MLTRLDADIAAATDPVAADCLRAERAAYLARQGNLSEATEALEAIRRRHAMRPNAAVSAWVSLAEGIHMHFTDMDPRARDKVLRAYALSTAADLRPIRANCAAWMAHLEYARLNVDLLGEYARLAIELVDSENRAATSRVCLVVGQSLHFAGARESAEPWYKRTREIALSDGDDPTLTALSHNMAWLYLSDLRNSYLTQNETAAAYRLAVLGAESYAALAKLLRDNSFAELLPTLHAQLLSLSGRFEEAIGVYERILSDSRINSVGRFCANLFADFAWCCSRAGDNDRAFELASRALKSIDKDTQIDEVAATFSLLRFVYDRSDSAYEATVFAAKARDAWTEFRYLRDAISRTLNRLDVPD
jgi:tetratricopeptide (TPR) repeat protein